MLFAAARVVEVGRHASLRCLWKVFSVGVQVPPLALDKPRADSIPARFLLIGLLALCVSCAQSGMEAASAAKVALEKQAQTPSDAFLDMLTPASKAYVKRIATTGLFSELRSRMLSILKHPKDTDMEGLIAGSTPDDTLFFVRDGYSRRLDLTLSGVTFVKLHEIEYPVPW